MTKVTSDPSGRLLRERLQEIVFEADTPAGKAFDVVLILSILASVVVVMLDSVELIHTRYGTCYSVWNGRSRCSSR